MLPNDLPPWHIRRDAGSRPERLQGAGARLAAPAAYGAETCVRAPRGDSAWSEAAVEPEEWRAAMRLPMAACSGSKASPAQRRHQAIASRITTRAPRRVKALSAHPRRSVKRSTSSSRSDRSPAMSYPCRTTPPYRPIPCERTGRHTTHLGHAHHVSAEAITPVEAATAHSLPAIRPE